MNNRQFDAAHDRYLNPPELCECCEEYNQYRNGLCWNCWIDGQDRRAEERHDRRVLNALDLTPNANVCGLPHGKD